MEHRWEGVVDSDCGENSEKEVKNEGKEKKSVIIRETFLPDYFCHSFSPTFFPPIPHGWSEGDGDVSAAGKRARDLSREFFPVPAA